MENDRELKRGVAGRKNLNFQKKKVGQDSHESEKRVSEGILNLSNESDTGGEGGGVTRETGEKGRTDRCRRGDRGA